MATQVRALSGRWWQPLTEDQKQMAERYAWLPRNVASWFMTRWSSPEDREAHGTMGLIYAASSFKPEKGFGFYGYATFCIKAEITYARARGLEGLVRVPRKAEEAGLGVQVVWGSTSIGVDGSDLLSAIEDRREGPRIDSESRIRFQRAVQSLPARQRRAVRLRYIKGMRRKDVARELGVSTRYTNRLIQEALQRLSTSHSLAELAS
ncbi:sigma-70 family RNA polymerase sigma factor [Paludisphaera rhizosphaerae]|uniref:sigma-70 family RNA polymerase sigma factor n=1 Tax=Paludisphaera rhizosphaerae TaxID=2711216 RepID=UPI0013ED6338|nr:sigma-70 family RNA polymerase sigma factor [Paludisphaera rhizosphaerae]